MLGCQSLVRSRRFSRATFLSPQTHSMRFSHRLEHGPLHPHEFKVHKGEKYFDKILVANRGEIACRVMRTAKRLGIKTVAIYSEPDVNSVHVRLADEAYCVGPAVSRESYLNIPNVVKAVKQSGAQAVHPGYGFLSENPLFVKALEEAGVVFLGPGSSAMNAMGDKIESKKLARKAGVNTIPGFLGEVEDEASVLRIANEIGYPVMVKASAGGGGKGMRIAWNDKEVLEGFRLSRQEARNSFGNDRMLIEKFIDNPRHIEIQIICDGQGTSLYLPERECSIQRRNQKVIEEAPSVHLDDSTRVAMGKQAVALADAVGYRSAGTVEFLVDPQRNFYFLEMNTRLQVEHPITEYITGIDLVEQMIRVGAGKKLLIQQKDITIKGWAVESRVYAEDPLRGFLPCIGKLEGYVEPPPSSHVRCDSGIVEGSEISVFYDPLISKLVTYGKTRAEANAEMARALDRYIIRGLTHNVCFLRELLEHPRYQSGKISTKFIPEEFPNGYHGHLLTPEEEIQLGTLSAAIDFLRKQRNLTISGQSEIFSTAASSPTVAALSSSSTTPSASVGVLDLVVTLPRGSGRSATNTASNTVAEREKQKPVKLRVQVKKVKHDSDKELELTITREGETSPRVLVVKHSWPVDSFIFEGEVDGKNCVLQLLSSAALSYTFQFIGTQYQVGVMTAKQDKYYHHMKEHVDHKSAKLVLSPMPGMLHSIAVKVGDKVHRGQELLTLEAMKMQNIIRAERDAVIKAIPPKVGTEVSSDQVLVEFE